MGRGRHPGDHQASNSPDNKNGMLDTDCVRLVAPQNAQGTRWQPVALIGFLEAALCPTNCHRLMILPVKKENSPKSRQCEGEFKDTNFIKN